MSTEILFQDEVDALLKGVNGVNGDDEVDAAPESSAGPKPCNLARQERIVRGRMPTLEIINERFARPLRVGLFNFLRRSPEIPVGPVRVTKYGEFVRNLVQPTNLNIVQTKPLRGNSPIIFDPTLVFTLVDNMFGGDSRINTRVEGAISRRPMSASPSACWRWCWMAITRRGSRCCRRYGVRNGQYAIKVEKIIAVSQNEDTAGDTHA